MVPLIDYQLAETAVLDDGRTVEWEALGVGPPLIWVEGGPGLWAHLARPDVQLVSDTFRCYLVNAPGCGRTSPPQNDLGYSLPEIIAFFEAVREGLGLGRVTVMGHSWGGLVAASWAAAHPESVERLIVIDGYPGGPAADEEAALIERDRVFARHAEAPWCAAAIQAITANEDSGVERSEEAQRAAWDPAWPMFFANPESSLSATHIARLKEEVRTNVAMEDAWLGDIHHFDHINIVPSLAAVSCPTIVFVGEYDFICGPAWNRPIAEAISGARYVEIAGAGHIPQYEEPDVFRQELLHWLSATG